MIYFIHGFEWPYDIENTIRINEYNETTLYPDKEKTIILHSAVRYTLNQNHNEIHFDKVIYKYKLSDNETVWNYGLVFNENDFWQNIQLSINKLEEQTPNIRNIRIPYSLFRKNCKNLNCKDLLIKIYNELSENGQFDFFILLEQPSEVHNIYDNFESNDTDINIFDQNAKIISHLIYGQTNSLKNKTRLLKWKNINLGNIDLEENLLCLVLTDEGKFENEIDEIKKSSPDLLKHLDSLYDKYGKRKQLKNYSRDLREQVGKLWIKIGYIKYGTVLRYDAKFAMKNPTDRSKFFSLFGYLPSSISDGKDDNNGNIPEGVSKLIIKYLNEKKFYDKKRNVETLLDRLRNIEMLENNSWTKAKLEKFTQKNRSKKYSIDRRSLFSLVFALNLDYEEATRLFETSYCKLKDSLLLEDKILLCVLKNFEPIFSLDDDNYKYRFKIFLSKLRYVFPNI